MEFRWLAKVNVTFSLVSQQNLLPDPASATPRTFACSVGFQPTFNPQKFDSVGYASLAQNDTLTLYTVCHSPAKAKNICSTRRPYFRLPPRWEKFASKLAAKLTEGACATIPFAQTPKSRWLLPSFSCENATSLTEGGFHKSPLLAGSTL